MPLLAAMDWSAHVVWNTLALRTLPPAVAEEHAEAVLAGAVLIDVDHGPIAAAMLRGAGDLPRPRPHTFATPLVLAAVPRLRGLALGTAVHLTRDLFNGPGVEVAWPLRPGLVRLPVAAEAAVLAALVSAASRRSR